MLLAIRFFEPLFGALIVVPFFGLPPWLLRFKLDHTPSKILLLHQPQLLAFDLQDAACEVSNCPWYQGYRIVLASQK